MKTDLDFGWGDCELLRECLPKNTFSLGLDSMRYPDPVAEQDLLKEIRKFCNKYWGKDYKYIVVTPGATFGIYISLLAVKNAYGIKRAITPPQYFSYYPKIIACADMEHIVIDKATDYTLLDSPNNPTGEIIDKETLIWDSVYHCPAFCSKKTPVPEHIVAVGSAGKMTGLNGLRLGWVATNDDGLGRFVSNMVNAVTCGTSLPGQHIFRDFLKSDVDQFFEDVNKTLNNNRKILQQLEPLVIDGKVPDTGMFWCLKPSDKLLRALLGANVTFTPGEYFGKPDYIRINMARNSDITKTMVKLVLEAAGIGAPKK